MAGTYWLTVLPDTSKLAPELKKSLSGLDSKPLDKVGKSAKSSQGSIERLGGSLSRLPGPMGRAGGAVGKFGKQFSNLGGDAETGTGRAKNAVNKLSLGIAGMGLAAGGALLKIGDTFDDLGAGIAAQTGASGKNLNQFVDMAKEIGTTVPVSFKQAGDAVAILSQKTDLTGDALQGLSGKLADVARMSGQSATGLGSAFAGMLTQWQIKGEDSEHALSVLFDASQKFGAPLSSITQGMNLYGQALQSSGFSMQETVGLFGRMSKAGLPVSRLMPGLAKAFAGWSKEGKDSKSMLTQTVAAIKDAKSPTEALAIATDTFGQSAGVKLVSAIQSGQFAVEGLGKTLDDADGSIEKSSKNTTALHEQLTLLKNKALDAVAPAAAKVFETVTKGLSTFSDWVSNSTALQITLKAVVAVLGTMGASVLAVKAGMMAWSGIQSVITIGTKAWAAAQWLLDAALNANPIGLVVIAVAALAAGIIYAYKHSETFRNIIEGLWDAIKTGIGWVGDKMMWLWHNVFEPAWEGIKTIISTAWSGIKTEFDIGVKAFDVVKSALTTVKDAFSTAFNKIKDIVLGVWNSISGVWDKISGVIDKVKGFASGAADVGKSIISHIPGLATGGQIVGPGTGTSDSVLLRASHGEFLVNANATADHLPLLQAVNSGALPGFAAGGLVNARAYQQVASMVGTPYQMGGFSQSGIDCSGMASSVVNSYLGLPMFDSRMSTPSEGSWLRDKGAQPGRGGLGDLTVLWWDGGTGGFSNGHTEAILPNGQVIESGGSHGNVAIGAGTTPASDSQWTNAAHFPEKMLKAAQNPQLPGGGSTSGSGRARGSGSSGGGGPSILGGSAGGGGAGGFGATGGGQEAKQLGGMIVSGMKDELGGVLSNPLDWPNVKSGEALLNFLGGKLGGGKQGGGGGGGVLGGIGEGIGLGGLFSGITNAAGGNEGPWTPKHPGDTLSPGLFNPTMPGNKAPSFTAPNLRGQQGEQGVTNDNRTIFNGDVDGDVSKALTEQHKQRVRRTRTTKVGG